MWVATWPDYGERKPCNPGSLVLYIVSYSNRATFVTIYLLPLPLYPLPSPSPPSLSLSLVFRSHGDWIFITVQKKGGGRKQFWKALLCKERVETAVEEEDGDRGFFDRTERSKSWPILQLGGKAGKGCISVSVATKFRVERYWSGRGKLGNWIPRAPMKENRSKTGNYLRFGPKVSRK